MAELGRAFVANLKRRGRRIQLFGQHQTPGFSQAELARLDENLGALKVELTAADLRNIDSASALIKIEGARYPEKLEALTGR